MTSLTRIAVDLFVLDPRDLAAMDPEYRPENPTVRTEIVLTSADAARLEALTPGEDVAAWVRDRRTKRRLCVIREDDETFLAGADYRSGCTHR